MKIEHFRQAVEIARTNSFSQAARNLYISQPTLSHSIKQLETELGQTIFERFPNGIVVTDFGKTFIHHASIILKEYDILEEYCENPEIRHFLSLRIATLNINRVSEAFSKMIKKYTAVPIDFSLMQYISLEKIIERLVYNQADLGIIRIISPYLKSTLTKLQNNQLEYHRFSDSRVYAMIGKEHPLYGKQKTVKMEELSCYPIIVYGNDSDSPSYSLARAMGATEKATGIVRVNSEEILYSSIEKTEAYSLVAFKKEIFYRKYTDKYELLEISDCPISVEYGWIKLKKVAVSELGAEFLNMVRDLF